MNHIFDLVPLDSWGLFPAGRPCIIAGPCSAESEEQVMAAAGELASAGVKMFRAGIWKPRTRPGNFEGVGERGLKWLSRVKSETGMAVCTEVARGEHVRACLDAGIDMLWIGARTTTNPFLMQEIAESLRGADIPVLVKNPINPDMELWLGALERLNLQGLRKIGIVHRGFSTFDRIKYRNAPYWQVVIEMRTRFPKLPIFCDPSHMSGERQYIREIAQHSLDLGLDGLMIESHCNPECALSDSRQQLTPSDLADMLARLSVRETRSEDPVFNNTMMQLRSSMDELDSKLVRLLGERMKISRLIGENKKTGNVSIIQVERWEEVMKTVHKIGSEYGMDNGFLDDVFNIIHDASAEEQNKILEEK